MRIYGYLAGAALALAACAGRDEAPPPLTVSDVAVTSDLTAITSQEAAQYWGNLNADLESAIAGEFVGQTDPSGVAVVVDVDELSLSEFLNAGADARLTGDVAVLSGLNGEQVGFYTVTASASQAATILASGQDVVTVSPTSEEFYRAVVQAFASGVAQAVRGGGTAAAAG